MLPRVRVTDKTLKDINQLQGYLQMASGERVTQDETISYAVSQAPKVVQTTDEKGKVKMWILDLRARKRKR